MKKNYTGRISKLDDQLVESHDPFSSYSDKEIYDLMWEKFGDLPWDKHLTQAEREAKVMKFYLCAKELFRNPEKRRKFLREQEEWEACSEKGEEESFH